MVAVTDADGNVTGWKCYILNDDGTTATQNGWVKYDQAKCQTFDIAEGVYENVSNTYYWRLVTDVSTENEAITETVTETSTDEEGNETTTETTVELYDGKKFGWIILSKSDCESSANDEPKAGDTIVLDGHRMFATGDAEGRDQYNDESRTNVMMLETTGTDTGSLPRIVALAGITDYKHSETSNQYSNTVFILSPKEVVFVSSAIKWVSATGDPITFVNFRGAWTEGTSYAYYDQVSHDNAIWTCIAEKGTTTTLEPTDANSAVWRKEISGGKGEKGEAAVTYGVQVSPYYYGSSKTPGLWFDFTKTTGAKTEMFNNVTTIECTVAIYADGTYYSEESGHINGGAAYFLYSSYPNDPIDTASVVTVMLYHDGILVATTNIANGKEGMGAMEISVSPDTVIFDTDDNGLVSSSTSKTATISCYRDGKKVENVEYALPSSGDPDCNATISTANSIATVTISGISTDATYGVSKTGGTVKVQVYDVDNGRYYYPTVKFAVNVAKFNGSMVANNKKFETVYNELTNNGSSTDLTWYESKLEQTARNISLKVQEKNVGRRNLLVGSAFRKQESGFCKIIGGYISINGGYECRLCSCCKSVFGHAALLWCVLGRQSRRQLRQNRAWQEVYTLRLGEV